MKKLLLKALIFTAPVLVVFSYPLFVMATAGEFTTVDQIISLHSHLKKPCLILTAYSDPWSYAKLKSVQINSPNALVLGTSRVMQFRKKFFQTSFYNASRGISDLPHLRIFWNQIPKGRKPEVLILGLDPNLLNPNWVYSSTEALYRKPSWKEGLLIFAKHWDQVYLDTFKGDVQIREFFGSGPRMRKVGLLARAGDRGFTNDGSFLYGDYIGLSIPERRLTREAEYEKALKQIERGEGIYAPSQEVSKEKIKILEAFLKEAADGNTHVIAYIPPFAPPIYKRLLEKKEEYQYLWKIHADLEPLFKKYGFQIFDFQDPSIVGAADDDFVDDLHDSGRVTFNLLLKMINSDVQLMSLSSTKLDELQKEELKTLVSPFPAE